MRLRRVAAVVAVLALWPLSPTSATDGGGRYIAREVMIPWSKAGSRGLNALIMAADRPGRHPLVVLTHGTSRDSDVRAQVSPWQLLSQATWFARRGWVSLVVVRRGYGRSGGDSDTNTGHGPFSGYVQAGEESAADMRQAIAFGAALPEVDPRQVLAAGVSTGGFATVALTADPPPGLVAAINFSGGRGSVAARRVRDESQLIGAYRVFGKRSRTPMLWLYAEGDSYFWPELAQQFHRAFLDGGGNAQLLIADRIGPEGHALFNRVATWEPLVDRFLAERGLTLLPEPLPAPTTPDVPPPPGLSDAGIAVFRNYLNAGPHKAYAVSEHGHGGFAAAQLSIDSATKLALDRCRHASERGDKCRIVSIDGEPVEH